MRPTVILTAIATLQTSTLAMAASPVATTIVHSFSSLASNSGNPGSGPVARGPAGTLNGVSPQGGAYSLGAVWGVSPSGSFILRHSIPAAGEGVRPGWGLVRDSHGTLYGTSNASSGNRGIVFKISPTNVFTVLHSFAADNSEGQIIDNGVILGKDGLLYGITLQGGPGTNVGTIYRLATNGTGFTTLTTFQPATQGLGYPQGTLTQGPDGAFYGINSFYIDSHGNGGNGAVFRYALGGTPSVYAPFPLGSGEGPARAVTFDAAGAAYLLGTASNSVTTGRIYRIPAGGGTPQILHQFGTNEGIAGPYSTCLTLGADGRLYGVATDGGDSTPGSTVQGTAFAIDTSGAHFQVLHRFGETAGDARNPVACPTQMPDGSFWGTSWLGGDAGNGTLYRLAKPAVKLILKPSTITAGGHAKLSWAATDSAACTVSGPGLAGVSATSGTVTLSPAAAGSLTYTATCQGAGTVARSTILTVN